MNPQETQEHYLETILMAQQQGPIRAIDLADALGYSRPTISTALRRLGVAGLVSVDKRGYVELSEEGREIAERMYERHRCLTQMLIQTGVEEEIARAEACKIEHDISETTFACLKRYFGLDNDPFPPLDK